MLRHREQAVLPQALAKLGKIEKPRSCHKIRGFLQLSYGDIQRKEQAGMRQHSVIHTPKPSDYQELTQVWEASVRATHDFLPDSYIELLKTWCSPVTWMR